MAIASAGLIFGSWVIFLNVLIVARSTVAAYGSEHGFGAKGRNMSLNLDNALHGLQEARAGVFLETGNPLNTMEQEEALEAIQVKINEAESLINAY